ncbi:helix-turn-helix transcriptional regulator [Nocardiopsis exhalans]|uniref:Helix-turn-helix transcriptional regulator n=1 Tax=Nocardiopsis exhalans TaxID=163604 RepID=A0ABY5DFA7_9ACTN|nr:helix-turn-helix transcriptional regulator [Nocardiopsis exhalans]USY23044.1 helix-turn-helix transcriptional regulator [Nocardiopsis exhalans]
MDQSGMGAFLRECRESTPPGRVGLAVGARRRTPGLRRAELATLSGVSVDYLTRLEQGRDRNPSPQVLVALADALGLAVGERVRLRNLSKVASGAGALCPGGLPPERGVRAVTRALLERLEPAPAALFNRLGETLAHTKGYERLMGPLGLLDVEDDQPANRVWFVFADDRARSVYPDWEVVADARLAELRAEAAPQDPHLAHLVEELAIVGGAPFTERMALPESAPLVSGVERLSHPQVGELRLSYERWDAQGQYLVVYLPADQASEVALDRLIRAGLRAVGGEH